MTAAPARRSAGPEYSRDHAVMAASRTYEPRRAADSILYQVVRDHYETFRVAGVAPRGFTGAGIEPVDAWIALSTTTPGLPPGWQDAANDRRLSLIGRPHEGGLRHLAVHSTPKATRAMPVQNRTRKTPVAIQK